jgi:SAM-dependent methyltransferase
MEIINSFNPFLFKRLREAEEKHFWFKVRRQWIFDKVKRFIPPPAKFLEAGCGTGNISSFLAQKGYEVIGCEYYPEAFSISWPDFMKVQGDANNLPFKNDSFDVVGLFDMIEHFQDDTKPIKEAIRVLNGKGILVITVPAREELWSWFDESSQHKRRYSIKRLKEIFSLEMNLKPLLMEYMFMSLYMPMKWTRKKCKKSGGNQLKINRYINVILNGLFNMERIISKVIPLPIGTSIIAVAQKALIIISFILISTKLTLGDFL